MRLKPRGAAVVEMSVSMLVILPLIFYTLFLNDLLFYKLDQQEGIITPAWDFTIFDYQAKNPGKPAEVTQRLNRLKFCDHSSAYDSYEQQYDCADSVHHNAMAAHQCWVTQGGQQISCKLENTDLGTKFEDSMSGMSGGIGGLISGSFSSNFTKGGLSNCSARLAVFNKFVPHQIFTKAGGHGSGLGAGSDGTALMKQGRHLDTGGLLTDIHGAADPNADDSVASVGEDDQFFFNPSNNLDRHAMLHDSWALMNLEAVSENMGGIKAMGPPFGSEPFNSRVGYYYTKYGDDAFDKADDFHEKLRDNFVDDTGMSIPVLGDFYSTSADGPGDSVRTAPVKFSPTEHLDASGNGDQKQQDMASNRSDSYFGGQ